MSSVDELPVGTVTFLFTEIEGSTHEPARGIGVSPPTPPTRRKEADDNSGGSPAGAGRSAKQATDPASKRRMVEREGHRPARVQVVERWNARVEEQVFRRLTDALV
jgi:hypothetical protein